LEPTSLPAICSIAFGAVFALLAILAIAMYCITLLFPDRSESIDPVLVAAISGAVATVLPGAKLIKIEEEK
jgi:hypothetical protein